MESFDHENQEFLGKLIKHNKLRNKAWNYLSKIERGRNQINRIKKSEKSTIVSK